MGANLITGAAGSGKTHAAIQHVIKAMQRDPFSTTWVLLPTDLQIGSFRERLLIELGKPVYFGVEFFDFYALYGRLLQIAGVPQRRVTDTARFRILRNVLETLQREPNGLTHFSRISQMPGFIRLAADFIEELKQARVSPEKFSEAAQTPRDQDLARIYSAYQSFLRERNLVDSEGEGWLALAQLDAKPNLALPVGLLIVDGYDQFTRVQAELLGLLAKRINRMVLTLTYEAARTETAHRRFAQTYARLHEHITFEVATAAIPVPHPAYFAERAAPLDRLSRALFEPSPERITHNDTVTLIEAPDPRREVEVVLRRVKRALREGASPDSIAIVTRDLTPYAAYLRDLVGAYGIPVASQMGTPLAENPAVASLLALIDLAAEDFRRRMVMDSLHNPYVRFATLDTAQIDHLERISRQHVVISGRTAWRDTLTRSAMVVPDEDGELPTGTLDPIQVKALHDALDSFFTRITPPPTGTARDLTHWIEGLIAALDESALAQEAVITREGVTPNPSPEGEGSQNQESTQPEAVLIISGTDITLTARDSAALACFQRVLADLLAAYELIDGSQPVRWEQFRLELATAVDNMTITPSREHGRAGRVLISSVFAARGLSHDSVYVLGLSEGVFPARIPEDALYHDSEREPLRAAGLALLTHAERADESSLFYEITALARHTLILTRPYSDGSNPWPPSAYWRAVQAVIDAPVERVPMDSTPLLDHAARFSEVISAVSHGLNQVTPDAQTLGAHRWLITHPEHAASWQNALTARRVEVHRASAASHDQYSGVLMHQLSRAAAADALGADHLWSATQLNDYGLCPFKFFARRLMRLEPLTEPESGITPIQSGNLIHEVLEQLYQHLAEAGLRITPENKVAALALLDSTIATLFADAPTRHAFEPGALWDQEQATLRTRLIAFVARDFSEDSPISELLPGARRPLDQEAGFGRGKQVIIDGSAGPIRAQGFIDRMDEATGRVLVIDYKSGATTYSLADMIAGRNAQMLIYIFAARALVKKDGLDVIGGTFWHLKNRELSGQTLVTDDEKALDEAREALHERVIAARRGQFPNTPSKQADGKCARFCEYSQMCRVKSR